MSADPHIDRLTRRFKPTSDAPPRPKGKRERTSMYIDTQLAAQVDRALKDQLHALYPTPIDKADLLEELLLFGLDHLDQIRDRTLARRA